MSGRSIETSTARVVIVLRAPDVSTKEGRRAFYLMPTEDQALLAALAIMAACGWQP